MRGRPFPETVRAPNKRIFLIPVALIFGGLLLTYLHPWLSTGFFGIVISLAGVVSFFFVGLLFADFWASAHLTKSLMKDKGAVEVEEGERSSVSDPFEDELDSDK